MAARTEHLKRLARTQPDEPATCELTEDEIQVLIFAKRRIKTSVELVPDGIPPIKTAVRWIADLGGWAVTTQVRTRLDHDCSRPRRVGPLHGVLLSDR
ncbi:MAG: hypothetical protein IPL19_15435 [Sandaracinaceae bacterium]|nr:hypothetical protein [Sandaracinaceae bacterium]